ncbi:MAG TPA: hypothetical protein VIW24_28920 [Aldersonia sp.]
MPRGVGAGPLTWHNGPHDRTRWAACRCSRLRRGATRGATPRRPQACL